MKLRLPKFSMVLSLLPCLAACATSARSYWVRDALGHWHRKTETRGTGPYAEQRWRTIRFRGVESAGGMVGVRWYRVDQRQRSPAVFAQEWEPSADEGGMALRRMPTEARQLAVPFHAWDTGATGAPGL